MEGTIFPTFHLIELDPSELLKDNNIFIEFKGNDDLKELQSAFKKDGQLQDHGYRAVKLYMVVDGQQRLTSLFLLGHIFAACTGGQKVSDLFYVVLRGGVTKIPRLIQHPGDDHRFFSSLAQQLISPNPNFNALIAGSQSQERMLNNAKHMTQWGQNNKNALNFISSQQFKTSIIQLDAHFGLTSFMTLNDQGKQLTNLEKLKSLLLQYTVDVKDNALTRQLHTEFGKLYKVLDLCVFCGLFDDNKDGDDQLVRLLSCYLRIANDSQGIWEGPQAAYDNFFRKELQDAAASPRML